MLFKHIPSLILKTLELTYRVGKMAPSTRFFPHKHEDLNLISRTNITSLGMVVYACNPKAGKRETDKYLVLDGQSD